MCRNVSFKVKTLIKLSHRKNKYIKAYAYPERVCGVWGVKTPPFLSRGVFWLVQTPYSRISELHPEMHCVIPFFHFQSLINHREERWTQPLPRSCSNLWRQYAVKAQTSLAPLSRFRGSHVTTAHAHQCCRFQTYAKTVPSRLKLTSEIDKAWTTFLGSTTTDHVITSCDVWL